MGLDVIENVVTLAAAVTGLLLTLFRYIETPKRGWMFISIFFLSHFLSDYYWTMYTLVVGENPAVSEMMAYFGWNVGYVMLLLAALHMRPGRARRFFHPLMLIPIPVNLAQFFIYIQYGGLFNNIWEGFFATATACVCLEVILSYRKHRSEGEHFPWTHTMLLLYIIAEYGMWTSSCYTWPNDAANPYYYFAFAGAVVLIFFGRAIAKDYEAEGFVRREKIAQELNLQIIMDFMVSGILLVGCVGGYVMANLMKSSLPEKMRGGEDYTGIANMLFVISLLLVFLIIFVIFTSQQHYRRMEETLSKAEAIRRGRLNFVFTVFVTLVLMVSSVIYTSRLFYRVSVMGLNEDGNTKAATTAMELENYLVVAKSTLWVTADTVDLMIRQGASQKEVLSYIKAQTKNQSEQFDENFTGIYAYYNGEFLDGAGWIPPKGYDAQTRDWYKAAVAADGETTIVSPYVDAQTGSVVITICKMINDGTGKGADGRPIVVALDMVVNHVQEVVETVSIEGKGYGMVLNYDGLIIAHHDKHYDGKNIRDYFGEDFMKAVAGKDEGHLSTVIDGQKCTVFVKSVMSQWYVVIPVTEAQLFKEIYRQLLVNIIVSLVVALLISFFYYLGYKNEQLNAKKLEELRSSSITREYEARMLKLQKDAADEANRAKSQFLAQMSHEIRTPINAVLGMNEMVLRETEDAEILEYSRNIQSAGRTLLFLINSILDFSKIEDGKMELVPVSYDVAVMINDLIHSIEERAQEKKLAFHVRVDETLPSELYGDDVRIKQVIVNLLTNAVKYTEKGSVTLSITNAGTEGEFLTLHVSVKDTGIGIREEDMDRLFRAFERIDEQRNRNIEGTGLGMAIVTEFLRMMGSELDVESTYGEGSEFSFDLKQKIVSAEPVGSFEGRLKELSESGGKRKSLKVNGARILVVDDNSMNLKVAKGLLKHNGVRADMASSGMEAIEIVRSEGYDLIFLDHMMPKMDGIETLENMRRENILPDETRVIALTANAVDGARETYLSAGFDGYLSKPIEIDQLEDILKTNLPPEMIASQEEEDQREQPREEPAKEESVLERLAGIGIDVESGLAYCGEEEEFYLEILRDYLKGYDEKRVSLQEFYDTENWHDYQILVHALKSTSLSVGANDLSGEAKSLELAVRDGDIEWVHAQHSIFMKHYEELVNKTGGIV